MEFIEKVELLHYLQAFLRNWIEYMNKYGMEDEQVKKELDRLCACRSMAQTLINDPIYLYLDGTISVGYKYNAEVKECL